MTRQALIITNPGEPEDKGTEEYCEGVYGDARRYRSFLMEPQGGSWEGPEIRTFDRPDVSTVEREVERLKRVDYSLVVFAGHGGHSGKSTIVALRRGQQLNSVDLRVGAPKHTLILDCCREVAKRTLLTEEMAKALKSIPMLNSQRCRAYYDQVLRECATGLVVLFACSIDERANDDGTMGYYSGSLIETTEEWVAGKTSQRMQTSPAALSVVAAHLRAVPKVRALSGDRQNPDYEAPRSGLQFPFCVVA